MSQFLVQFFSIPQNFAGEPIYVSSSLFAKEEVNELFNTSVALINERRTKARQNAGVSELVIFCREQELDPRPEGSNTSNWYANCASGRQHFMMFSAHPIPEAVATASEKEIWPILKPGCWKSKHELARAHAIKGRE